MIEGVEGPVPLAVPRVDRRPHRVAHPDAFRAEHRRRGGRSGGRSGGPGLARLSDLDRFPLAHRNKVGLEHAHERQRQLHRPRHPIVAPTQIVLGLGMQMHGPVLLANLLRDLHPHHRQPFEHGAPTLGAGYGVGEVGVGRVGGGNG